MRVDVVDLKESLDMHVSIVLFALLPLSLAGQGQPPPDTVPAPTNVPGAQYPRITSDLRAIFRIKAPEAQKVEFDLVKRYPAQKDADGNWIATSDPQAPGFHYYF